MVWCLANERVDVLWILDYLDGAADQSIVYRGRYDTWDALLRDLQRFLHALLAEWRNFSKHPYTANPPPTPTGDHSETFARLVHERRLAVPGGVPYRLQSAYWRQIEEYGDWDEDRALRDQELELGTSSD
jgi:hypothetical protein